MSEHKYKPGDIVRGTVTSVHDFGVFVELNGVSGFLHISEIAWRRFAHPNDVLKAGEALEVQILDVSAEHNRISLSRKRLLKDPWQDVAKNYAEGQPVTGIVIHLIGSGAFVELEDGIEGFLPCSEITVPPGASMLSAVKKGQRLTLNVSRIDLQNRRLSLTQKAP